MSYNITLDDDAVLNVPDTGGLISGTFKPTNSGTLGDDAFPAPAPAPSLANPPLLSVFNGTNPNGTWSLYVVDDSAVDMGSISGGWSLTITAEAIPEPSTWTLFGGGLLGLIALRYLRRRKPIA